MKVGASMEEKNVMSESSEADKNEDEKKFPKQLGVRQNYYDNIAISKRSLDIFIGVIIVILVLAFIVALRTR